MSSPGWHRPGHGEEHQDRNSAGHQGAPQDQYQWSPSDDLEEEELRLRIRLSELQRKRLNSTTPAGRPIQDPTGLGNYHQAPANAHYYAHGPHQPTSAPFLYDHSRVVAQDFMGINTHPYTNPAIPSYYRMPHVGSESSQPQYSIDGRFVGWGPQSAGPRMPDSLAHLAFVPQSGQFPANAGPSAFQPRAQAPPPGVLAHNPYAQHQQHQQHQQWAPGSSQWSLPTAPSDVYLSGLSRNTPDTQQTPDQAGHANGPKPFSPLSVDISAPFEPFMAASSASQAEKPTIPHPPLVPPEQGAAGSHREVVDYPANPGPQSPQASPAASTSLIERLPEPPRTLPKPASPLHVPSPNTRPEVPQLVAQAPSPPLDEVKTPQSMVPETQEAVEPTIEALKDAHSEVEHTTDLLAAKGDETASDTGVSPSNETSDRLSIVTRATSLNVADDSTTETAADVVLVQEDGLAPQTPTDPTAGFDEDETCNCGARRPANGGCHFCWPCNGTIFCDNCWDLCAPHKRRIGRQAQIGLPHEKSDPLFARRIFETLQSECNEEQQALLHDRDEDSSWFGTGKDGDTGDTVFRDFGRYSRLVEELSSRRRLTRFPALVSFVGQTGAGKSSLIRLLIETLAPTGSMPEVPVVGSTLHTDLPTSGDVHLYPDLNTFEGNSPIFYADCEGLNGGERQPMGAKKPKANTSNPRTHSFTQHLRKQHHTSEREIMWATTAETTSREYHVRHLYPRLLFTFSDVIVFVMKNPRVIENVIEQLIDWAAAALETSSNQPVLPHAVIVLNSFDNTSDPTLWDVNNSTVDLLAKVSRAVHQNHKLRKFAEFWREKGRQVETVETLLLSYYSSIRVVRFPEKGRPTLIHEQVNRLYAEVQEACQKSRESKHGLRMLLNSDELQPYLQFAFDHFCRNLERPFDFVQASLAFHPIPSDFGGNIIKMAINIMDVWRNRLDGPSLVKELSFLVASCIMLDSARRRNLGTSEKVFGGYVHHCDDALETFCKLHWPCEYVHPNTSGRCVNVKAGHQSKGHQLDNGKVLAVGDYQSDFTADRFRDFFEYSVAFNLRDLLRKLQSATVGTLGIHHDELSKAADIHKRIVLGPFFRHLSGAKQFVNHTACYCCLTCPPEHPLPCGHVLCTPCVQAFGRARGAFMIEMLECPMHHQDIDGQFRLRWPVFIKPPGAGVRILTLDGGGIRGIVELTILQRIETQLGAGLHIQAFFDLIVGTSAGGIVALGLGANGWTVGKCSTMFKSLCKQAFARKWAFALPGLDHLISFSGRARYETTAIEGALQQAFGSEQPLFAGSRELLENEAVMQRTTKVAVTTTTTGGTPALLANYNRTDTDDDAPYTFPRSEKPETEIKVFEAARATSAAPTVFKQFEHKASGQVYLDGAIHLNCPVGAALREQKLIWPENADRSPDIVLSIGTGFNTMMRKPVGNSDQQPRGPFAGVRKLYKTAVDNITTSLNAEKMWRDFLLHSQVPEHLKDRYVRLNLKLQKDPPQMDEVSQLDEIERKTRSQFDREAERTTIKSVADRLLATAFYFALEQEVLPASRIEADPSHRTVTGRFECRFSPHSSEIKSLGDTLRRRSRDAHRQVRAAHNPYFVICERRDGLDKSAQHVVEADVIDTMIDEGIFEMTRIKVTLSSRRAETEMFFCLGDQPKNVVWYPISGFPRFLVDELDRGPKVQRSSSAHVAKSVQYKLDWAEFERKRAEWTFTAAQHLSLQDPLLHYSSASYVNPGDASLDFLDSLKDRFEGKADKPIPEAGGARRTPSARREMINRWLNSTESLTEQRKLSGDLKLDTTAAWASGAREQDRPAELESRAIQVYEMAVSTAFPRQPQSRPSPAELDGVFTSRDLSGANRSGDNETANLLGDFSPTKVAERMVNRKPRATTGEDSPELLDAPFNSMVMMHWQEKAAFLISDSGRSAPEPSDS